MKELLRDVIAKTGLVTLYATAGWILASWADVICHNVNSYSYASWNLFMILTK